MKWIVLFSLILEVHSIFAVRAALRSTPQPTPTRPQGCPCKLISASPRVSPPTRQRSLHASAHPVRRRVKLRARGIVTPVFTPVNDDHSINWDLIPLYAEYLASNGMKYILLGGTTSENMKLNVELRKRLLDAWLAAGARAGLWVMFQVGVGPLQDVIELTRYGASKSVEAIVTLPEIYFKPTSVDELVFFVGLVAENAPDLPVIYYHFPLYTNVNVNMTDFVVNATARIPNFMGIKYTSFDLNGATAIFRRLRPDQQMYLAADSLLAAGTLLGITSSIGITYNLFPTLPWEILSAVRQGEMMKLRALQELLSRAIEAVTDNDIGHFIPRYKAGMEIMTGIRIGPPLLPERDISEDQKKVMRKKLMKLGLL